MKWIFIIGGVIVLMIVRGFLKTWKQMRKLQILAQTYKFDFRYYVEKEEGWTTADPPVQGNGWIKLVPNPEVTNNYFYYIKYDGPVNEGTAINALIQGFMHKQAMREGR